MRGRSKATPAPLRKVRLFMILAYVVIVLMRFQSCMARRTCASAGNATDLSLQLLHCTPVLSPCRTALMPSPCSIVSHTLHTWRVLRQDEVLAQFQVGSAAGENGGAIGQVVDGADVGSEGHGGVVEEAGAVGFFRGLEFVDEAGQKFAVGLVAHLGGLHALAG